MDQQYEMDELRAVLRFHAQKYPLIDILDAAKLIYQHVLGCEHAIVRPFSAYSYLKDELASLRQQQMPLLEDIGNGFSRVDLRALEANGVSVDELFDWFYRSSQYKGSMERFKDSLQLMREPELGLGFDSDRLDRFFNYYVSAGYPPVHHSARFIAAYAPAYRVVRTEFAEAHRII